MREYIKNVAIHYKGDYAKMHRHIVDKRPIPSYPYEGFYLCMGDRDYPLCFYQLDCPPYILFYMGNIELINSRCIAVIGNRRPSEYGLNMTEIFVNAQKMSYTIVSGLAYGIDGQAHKSALDHQTIAIVATGLDYCYPPEHRSLMDEIARNHLVLSEYPEGVRPMKHFFPFRNRLIACLGEKTVVMSARLKSGTMRTVDITLKLNKEVICLPHPITDSSGIGCNQLIQEGATVLTNMKDLYNI